MLLISSTDAVHLSMGRHANRTGTNTTGNTTTQEIHTYLILFFARFESVDNPVMCKEILKTVIPAGWDSRYALSSLWKMLGKHFSGQTQRKLLGRMDAALFC